MYLIVGLGNPGRKYDLTRHNAGFLAIDQIAEKLGAYVGRIKFKALISDPVSIGSEKVILMKPQTYMNLSGEAILSAVNYFNIKPENVIVIYDDKDIDFGRIRLRYKGSSGSHNGMKNIIYHLNSDNFPRIRIGIGQPKQNEAPLVDYVLQRFNEKNLKILPEILERVADAAISVVRDGIDRAMNIYNVEQS